MLDQSLLTFRPVVPGIKPSDTPGETFFHEVMRPVLKLLHRPLMEVFRNRVAFARDFSGDAKMAEEVVRKALASQPLVSAELTGVFLGWLTSAERNFFWEQGKVLNKKLKSLLIQRLADGLINPANG